MTVKIVIKVIFVLLSDETIPLVAIERLEHLPPSVAALLEQPLTLLVSLRHPMLLLEPLQVSRNWTIKY